MVKACHDQKKYSSLSSRNPENNDKHNKDSSFTVDNVKYFCLNNDWNDE